MPRLVKPRQLQPSLEPWQNYQQAQNALGSAESPMHSSFNPQSPIQQFQYNKGNAQIGLQNYKFGHGPQKNLSTSENSHKNRFVKRNQGIDFVKKNQQNLRSYHCMSQNYSALLNDDLDNFIPLNPNCGISPYLRRPTINTTYIGYYDEQPFFIDQTMKSRVKKEPKRSRSIDTNTRPRTSDPSLQHDYENNNQDQDTCQFYDRATLSVGGCHLQKMLKIKQKLRQKLKRNSQKKDIERGLYVKSQMKIEDQRTQTLQQNRSYVYSRTPIPSRKSSSNSIQSGKDKLKVDKWKQYMKMKNSSQIKSPSKSEKNGKFFAVLGGSIYK